MKIAEQKGNRAFDVGNKKCKFETLSWDAESEVPYFL